MAGILAPRAIKTLMVVMIAWEGNGYNDCEGDSLKEP
jgi:hypothetical protein